MAKILIVDDDQSILKVLALRLESEGFEAVSASDRLSATSLVAGENVDLALVDLKLGQESGIDTMTALREITPDLPVIIMTAYGTIDNAVEAMQKGAFSYVTKPFDELDLLKQVRTCLENRRLTLEVARLKGIIGERYGFENIVGRSQPFKAVLNRAAKAADTDSPVCLEGESGTGKELIAKAIHLAGSRKETPFTAVNCTAFPETLFESEFFGHVRGAFTGAVRNKQGLMSQVGKGTFFMDEISEMPLSMQAKLLRVLEEREFRPLGSTRLFPFEGRIITASNQDLAAAVQNGRFREDLYYRVRVITIHMPPLRDRMADIPILVRYFLENFTEKMDRPKHDISPEAMQKLIAYPWPGNVRELKNVIESAVALAEKEMIDEKMILTGNEEGEGVRCLKDARADFEKAYLEQLMEITQGNVSKAARLAGKYRADLYELLRKHGLEPDMFRNGNC